MDLISECLYGCLCVISTLIRRIFLKEDMSKWLLDKKLMPHFGEIYLKSSI